MAVEFTDAVVAGVTLVREAIQSQNFVQGKSGWQIAADGNAEFTDLTIRSSDGSQSTVTVANGVIEIRDGSGNLVARVDNGGFWCRDFQFPENITATLTAGQLQFEPLDTSLVDGYGMVQYGFQPAVSPDPAYVYTLISSGWVSSVNYDKPAQIILRSTQNERPVMHVGDSVAGRECDLYVDGDLYAGVTEQRPVPVPQAWQGVDFTWFKPTDPALGYQALRVRSDGSRVYLDGAAATFGTFDTRETAFTVPSGMGPLKAHFYDVPQIGAGNVSTIGCKVSPDGTVEVLTGGSFADGTNFDFSHISWPLD